MSQTKRSPVFNTACPLVSGDADFTMRSGQKITIRGSSVKIVNDKGQEGGIDDCEGYWPWGLWEGAVACTQGECLVLKAEDGAFLTLNGADVDPQVIDEDMLKTDEQVLAAIYVVASGGDPGSIYIVTETAVCDIYVHQTRIPRNKSFETDNKLSVADIPTLIQAYLQIEGIGNRGFGYDILELVRPRHIKIRGKLKLKLPVAHSEAQAESVPPVTVATLAKPTQIRSTLKVPSAAAPAVAPVAGTSHKVRQPSP